MPIRVLIVDSHEIIRAGVQLVCHQHDDLEVVGETSCIADARALMLRSDVRIDVVVFDPESGGIHGADQLRQWRQDFADHKILVFTANDSADYATHIMSAGASGYVIKKAGLDEMALAIRCLHGGRIFISHTHHAIRTPSVIGMHSVTLTPHPNPDASPGQPGGGQVDLSLREREVLELIADGMTNKQAAAKLFLSVKTVETYRARIMRKNQLRDRSELVRFARRFSVTTTPAPALETPGRR